MDFAQALRAAWPQSTSRRAAMASGCAPAVTQAWLRGARVPTLVLALRMAGRDPAFRAALSSLVLAQGQDALSEPVAGGR